MNTKLIVVSIFLALVSTTTWSDDESQPKEVDVESVTPTSLQRSWNGLSSRQAIENMSVTETVRTIDWIIFEHIECRSEWNQICEGTEPLEAPPGWQVCSVFYDVISERNTNDYRLTPAKWYTNDAQSPDRFRQYNLYMYSKGSRNALNRYGANIKLGRVGLRLISAEAVNSDRFREGCAMPPHD